MGRYLAWWHSRYTPFRGKGGFTKETFRCMHSLGPVPCHNWPLQKIPLHTIMLFVCHPDILHEHCLQFLLGVKIAPRESEHNVYAKFGVTNEEHYGILWYFLEWSIENATLFLRLRLSFTPTRSGFYFENVWLLCVLAPTEDILKTGPFENALPNGYWTTHFIRLWLKGRVFNFFIGQVWNFQFIYNGSLWTSAF